jgi:hypothetical protein
MVDPDGGSEITELDLQNSGSQQTVEQLTRAFDEVDAEGAMHGAFGSEGMNKLVERYRRGAEVMRLLRNPEGQCRECRYRQGHHPNCPVGRLGL